MLSQPVVCFDVDLEELAGQLQRKALTTMGATLSRDDEDDLHAFLIATVWELAEGFRPELDKRGERGFLTYATFIASRRVVDWMRRHAGDSRYSRFEVRRAILRPLSLDRPDPAGSDPDGGTLGEYLPDRASDPANDRGPTCAGVLEGGDSRFARDRALIHRRVTRIARRRAEANKRRARERELSRRTG